MDLILLPKGMKFMEDVRSGSLVVETEESPIPFVQDMNRILPDSTYEERKRRLIERYGSQ